MVVFLVAVVAVALMMIGLSITLMRKGHNIQGDVGDNPQMQSLGLECALKDYHHGQCAPESDNRDVCKTCTRADKDDKCLVDSK